MATEAKQLLERAATLYRSGNRGAAKKILQETLDAGHGAAEAAHRLSLIALDENRHVEAAAYLERALQLEPNRPMFHYSLGMLRLGQGDSSEASKSLHRALELKPDFAHAHNQLGILAQDAGYAGEAERHFQNALKADLSFAKAHNNLGNLLKVQGRIGEAIVSFHEALRLQPRYALAMSNLADALAKNSQLAEAEEWYFRAIEIEPENPALHSQLGRLCTAQWKFEQAEPLLRKALELDRRRENDWLFLAHTLSSQNKTEEAIKACGQALELNPDNFQAILGTSLSLPVIYRDCDHLRAARASFSDGMDRVADAAERLTWNGIHVPLAQLYWSNFLLAYQGGNDIELQRRYSGAIEAILGQSMPEFMRPLDHDPEAGDRRRVRIGFVSSFLRTCTVGAYFKSWIIRLDRTRFETFAYNTGYYHDETSEEIKLGASHYVQMPGKGLREIARQIRHDGLDILVFPEVGMDHSINTLSALRLAPVQCAAWGHPVTTGHSNIDHYLTCALMEPENFREHYTERLVSLGGIGTYYLRPLSTLPSGKRFPLPEGRHLYFCPQSLYKIHPDNDENLLDILERDSLATLVFFHGMTATVTRTFMTRLEQGMSARGLPSAKRPVFLPRMGHEGFLHAARSCDAMLDTLHWSGGNTSLDAISCGLPIVTLPGEFMRGRQSCAMLKLMGLIELIAHDRDEYVSTALRLGNDPAWRADIRQRMVQSSGLIFENEAPIRELEQFFLSVA